MARRICIINRKGGVGKTLTALSFGRLLARSSRKSLLVDLDPQHSLSKHIRRTTPRKVAAGPGERTVAELLSGKLKDIKAAAVEVEPNLEIIFGSYDLWDHAATLSIPILSTMLDQVDEMYDYILLDNGPNWTNLNQAAVWACRGDARDLILVPANPFMEDLEQAEKTIEKAKEISSAGHSVFLNMYKGTNHQKSVIATMQKKLNGSLCPGGIPFAQGLIGRYLDTGEEMNFSAIDKKSFAVEIKNLAESLLGERITAVSF